MLTSSIRRMLNRADLPFCRVGESDRCTILIRYSDIQSIISYLLGEKMIMKRIKPIPIIHSISPKSKTPKHNIIPYPIIPKIIMADGMIMIIAILPPKVLTK